jgi:molybdenum cofactor cytidylyltransferase
MVSFGAIVLAAGFSERMGTPKALLPYGNNLSFIEQVTEIYLEAGVNKIALIVNPLILNTIQTFLVCKKSQVIVVENREPEKGRLHSIKLGLEKLDKQPIFIQNVDNPFVTFDLLHKLVGVLEPNRYVSPYYRGSGGHPVLLSHEIAMQLKECDSEIPLNTFLAKYEQIKMEQSDSGVLVNINTMDDYRSAFK